MFSRGKVAVTDTLEITVDQDAEGVWVRLRGRLNIDSSPDFRDRLLAILRAQPSGIVTVDMTDVSYIDASGIATLIEGLRIAHNRGLTLGLNGLQDRLVHLFKVSGVLALFEKSGCLTASTAAKVT